MPRFTAIALAITGFCAAGSLQAQTHAVRANVPFDFAIANKLLPAGEYEFISQSDDLIAIQNRSQRISVLSTAVDSGEEAAKGSYLIFDRYGDQYFLNGIQSRAASITVHIPKSKQERNVERHYARLNNEPSQFLLALK